MNAVVLLCMWSEFLKGECTAHTLEEALSDWWFCHAIWERSWTLGTGLELKKKKGIENFYSVNVMGDPGELHFSQAYYNNVMIYNYCNNNNNLIHICNTARGKKISFHSVYFTEFMDKDQDKVVTGKSIFTVRIDWARKHNRTTWRSKIQNYKNEA